MTRNTLLIAGAATAIFVASALVADEWDKKTNITVNETILIPGKTLAPGKYVMKLMNSSSNRNIVQIFNEDQTQLQATILAFNNYRLVPKDKTVLEYWETPSGSPPALRAWFFPGDNYGQEFAYPKELAERLARSNNNAKVPYYEGPESPRTEDLAALKVNDVDASNQAAPKPDTAVAPPSPPAEPDPKATEPKVAVVEPAPVAQPEPAPTQPPTVIAQNDRPIEPAPAPSVSAQPPTVAQNDDRQSSELPVTATPVPLIALLGVMLISIAGLMTLRRA